MKTDSGLSAYCHGNVDSPGAMLANPCHPYVYTKGLSPLCDYDLEHKMIGTA